MTWYPTKTKTSEITAASLDKQIAARIEANTRRQHRAMARYARVRQEADDARRAAATRGQTLEEYLRSELERQLKSVCTPSDKQCPPRYADDAVPEITYHQAHGLTE